MGSIKVHFILDSRLLASGKQSSVLTIGELRKEVPAEDVSRGGIVDVGQTILRWKSLGSSIASFEIFTALKDVFTGSKPYVDMEIQGKGTWKIPYPSLTNGSCITFLLAENVQAERRIGGLFQDLLQDSSSIRRHLLDSELCVFDVNSTELFTDTKLSTMLGLEADQHDTPQITERLDKLLSDPEEHYLRLIFGFYAGLNPALRASILPKIDPQHFSINLCSDIIWALETPFKHTIPNRLDHLSGTLDRCGAFVLNEFYLLHHQKSPELFLGETSPEPNQQQFANSLRVLEQIASHSLNDDVRRRSILSRAKDPYNRLLVLLVFSKLNVQAESKSCEAFACGANEDACEIASICCEVHHWGHVGSLTTEWRSKWVQSCSKMLQVLGLQQSIDKLYNAKVVFGLEVIVSECLKAASTASEGWSIAVDVYSDSYEHQASYSRELGKLLIYECFGKGFLTPDHAARILTANAQSANADKRLLFYASEGTDKEELFQLLIGRLDIVALLEAAHFDSLSSILVDFHSYAQTDGCKMLFRIADHWIKSQKLISIVLNVPPASATSLPFLSPQQTCGRQEESIFLEIVRFIRGLVRSSSKQDSIMLLSNIPRSKQSACDETAGLLTLFTIEEFTWRLISSTRDDRSYLYGSIESFNPTAPEQYISLVQIKAILDVASKKSLRTLRWHQDMFLGESDLDTSRLHAVFSQVFEKRAGSEGLLAFLKENSFLTHTDEEEELQRELKKLVPKQLPIDHRRLGANDDILETALQIFTESPSKSQLFRDRAKRSLKERLGSCVEGSPSLQEKLQLLYEIHKSTRLTLDRVLGCSLPYCPVHELYFNIVKADSVTREQNYLQPWFTNPLRLSRVVELASIDRRQFKDSLADLRSLLCTSFRAVENNDFYNFVSDASVLTLDNLPYFSQEASTDSLDSIVQKIESVLKICASALSNVSYLKSQETQFPRLLSALAKIQSEESFRDKLDMLRVRSVGEPLLATWVATISELRVPLKKLADAYSKSNLSDAFTTELGTLLKEPLTGQLRRDVFNIPQFIFTLTTVGSESSRTIQSNWDAIKKAFFDVRGENEGSIILKVTKPDFFVLLGEMTTNDLVGADRILDFIETSFVHTQASSRAHQQSLLTKLRSNLNSLQRELEQMKVARSFGLPTNGAFLIKACTEEKNTVELFDIKAYREGCGMVKCIREMHPYLYQVDDAQLYRFITSGGKNEAWVQRLVRSVTSSLRATSRAPKPFKYGEMVIDKASRALKSHSVQNNPTHDYSLKHRLPPLVAVPVVDVIQFQRFINQLSFAASDTTAELSLICSVMLESSETSSSSFKGLLEQLDGVNKILSEACASEGSLGFPVDMNSVHNQLCFKLGVVDCLLVAGLHEYDSLSEVSLFLLSVATYKAWVDLLVYRTKKNSAQDLQWPVVAVLFSSDAEEERLVSEGFVLWEKDDTCPPIAFKLNPNVHLVTEEARCQGPSRQDAGSATRILIGRSATASAIAEAISRTIRTSGSSPKIVFDLCTLRPEDLTTNHGLVFAMHTMLTALVIGQGTSKACALPLDLQVTFEVLESYAEVLISTLLGTYSASMRSDSSRSLRPAVSAAPVIPEKNRDRCLNRLSDLINQQSTVTDDMIVDALRELLPPSADHHVHINGDAHQIPFTYNDKLIEVLQQMVRCISSLPYSRCIILAGSTGVGKSYIAQKFYELLHRAGFPVIDKGQVLTTFHAMFDHAHIDVYGTMLTETCENGTYTFPILDEATASPAQSELDRLLLQQCIGCENARLASKFLGKAGGLIHLVTCNPQSSGKDLVFRLTPAMENIAIMVPEAGPSELRAFLFHQLSNDVRGPQYNPFSPYLGFALSAFEACRTNVTLGIVSPRSAAMFTSIIVDLRKFIPLITPEDSAHDVLESKALLVAFYIFFGVRTVPREKFFHTIGEIPFPESDLPLSVKDLILDFENRVVAIYPTSDLVSTDAFCQNILCMTFAAFSRKPLLVIGSHGKTSKTTSLGVVTSNMQGKYSTTDALRRLPGVQNFRLQLAETTTAMDINALERAVMALGKSDSSMSTPSVIIEELSMMNRTSADGPLRAFHSLLDQHQMGPRREMSQCGSGTNEFAFIATSNFDKGHDLSLPIGEPLANRMLILCHEESSPETLFDLVWSCAQRRAGYYDHAMLPDNEAQAKKIIRRVAESGSFSLRSCIAFASSALYILRQTHELNSAFSTAGEIHLRTDKTGAMRRNPIKNSEVFKIANIQVIRWSMERDAPRRPILCAFDSIGELSEMWGKMVAQHKGAGGIGPEPEFVADIFESGEHAQRSQTRALSRIKFACETGRLIGVVNPEPILNQIHALLNDFDLASSSIQIRKKFDVCHIAPSARIVLFIHRPVVQDLHEAFLSRVAYINPCIWPLDLRPMAYIDQVLEDLASASLDNEKSLLSKLDDCDIPSARLKEHIMPKQGESSSIVVAFMRASPKEPELKSLRLNKDQAISDTRIGTVVDMINCDVRSLIRNLKELRLFFPPCPRVGTKILLLAHVDNRALFNVPAGSPFEWRTTFCTHTCEPYPEWPTLSEIIRYPADKFSIRVEAQIEANVREMTQSMTSVDVRDFKLIVRLVRSIVFECPLMSEQSINLRVRWLLHRLNDLPRTVSLRVLIIEHFRRVSLGITKAILQRITLPLNPDAHTWVESIVKGATWQWITELKSMAVDIGIRGSMLIPLLLTRVESSDQDFPLFAEILAITKMHGIDRCPPAIPLEAELVRWLVRTYFQRGCTIVKADGRWPPEAYDKITRIYILQSSSASAIGYAHVLKLLLTYDSLLLLAMSIPSSHHRIETFYERKLSEIIRDDLEMFFRSSSEPSTEMLRSGSPFLLALKHVIASNTFSQEARGVDNGHDSRSVDTFLCLWRALSTEDLSVSAYRVARYLCFLDSDGVSDSDQISLRSRLAMIEANKTDSTVFFACLERLVDAGLDEGVRHDDDVMLDRSIWLLKEILMIWKGTPEVKPVLFRLFDRLVRHRDSCLVFNKLGELLDHAAWPETRLTLRTEFLRAAQSPRQDREIFAESFSGLNDVLAMPRTPSLDIFIGCTFFPLLSSYFAGLMNAERSTHANEMNEILVWSYFNQEDHEFLELLRCMFVRCLVAAVDESNIHSLKSSVSSVVGDWFDHFASPLPPSSITEWILSSTGPMNSIVLRGFEFCILPATMWSTMLLDSAASPNPLLIAAMSESSHNSLKGFFMPAMELSPAELIRSLSLGVSRCACGFEYAIGECTKPMQEGKCQNCGGRIGGSGHNYAPGNSQVQGHDHPISGVPNTWFLAGDGYTERELTSVEYRTLSVLMLMTLVVHGSASNREARIQQLRLHWSACKEVWGVSSDTELQELMAFLLVGSRAVPLAKQTLMCGHSFIVAEAGALENRKICERSFQSGFRAALAAQLNASILGTDSSSQKTGLARLRDILYSQFKTVHPLHGLRDDNIKARKSGFDDLMCNWLPFFRPLGTRSCSIPDIKDKLRDALLSTLPYTVVKGERVLEASYDDYPILWRLLFVCPEGKLSERLRPQDANALGLLKSARLRRNFIKFATALKAVNEFLIKSPSFKPDQTASDLLARSLTPDAAASFQSTWEDLRMNNELECQSIQFASLSVLPPGDILVSPDDGDDKDTPARVILKTMTDAHDSELKLVYPRGGSDKVSVLDVDGIREQGALIDWKRGHEIFDKWLDTWRLSSSDAITLDIVAEAEKFMLSILRMHYFPKALMMRGWDAPFLVPDEKLVKVSVNYIIGQVPLPAHFSIKHLVAELEPRQALFDLHEWAQIQAARIQRSRDVSVFSAHAFAQGLKAEHLDAIQDYCINETQAFPLESELPACLKVPLSVSEAKILRETLLKLGVGRIRLLLRILHDLVPSQRRRSPESLMKEQAGPDGDAELSYGDLSKSEICTLLDIFPLSSKKYFKSEQACFERVLGAFALTHLRHVISVVREVSNSLERYEG